MRFANPRKRRKITASGVGSVKSLEPLHGAFRVNRMLRKVSKCHVHWQNACILNFGASLHGGGGGYGLSGFALFFSAEPDPEEEQDYR